MALALFAFVGQWPLIKKRPEMKNKKRLTLHQAVALWWVASAPWAFAPAIAVSPRPDAGAAVAWGYAFVTGMILTMPILLRWPAFRRWYGWADALSDQQRQALAQRDLRRYYRTAFDDGYLTRVMPYAWRIIWTIAGLMAVSAVLPSNTGRPALDALVVFSTWYPTGVMLLIIASWPLGRMVEERRKRRS
jgi:hypothetical protein